MAEYKIQLGVKLNTSEIKSQVSKYNGNSNNAKLKLGVKLDTRGISDQIRAINSRTPVRVDLNLNVRNAQRQLDNIRRQIEQLGNIRINLGGTGGSGGRNGRNVINDTYRAYQELISLQNRIGSKQQAVAKLDTTRNQQEIAELTLQIDNLYGRYQRLYNLFSQNFSIEQLDNLNRNFQITGENIDIINRKLADTTSHQRARAEVENLENELTELRNIATQMGKLEIDIFKLDANSNANEIAELESQLNRLRAVYDNLISNLNLNNSNLNIGHLQELDAVFERTENRIAQLNARMADTSASQKLQSEYRELLNLAKQMNNLEIKIAGLDSKANANEVAELTFQLNNLRATYDKLMDSFIGNLNNPNLTAGMLGDIDGQFERAKNEIAQLEAKVADARAKLAEDIKINLNNEEFYKQVQGVKREADKLSSSYQKLDDKLDELNLAFNDMNTAKQKNDIDGLIEANERYEKALKEVKIQLDINKKAEQDAASIQKLADDKVIFQSKIDDWLIKNSAAAKKFGASMLDLKAKAESCDRTTLNHLQKEFKKLDIEADKAGLKMQTFGDRIRSQFAKYRDYFSVASVFMYATQGLKDMFNQVVAIDSAMTELKKVTDETNSSYDRFLSNAASRAKEIGTTIDGLVNSTADFARLGYSFADSQGLAEVANIYAVVGDEVEGVEGATESLISTMAAFKDEMNGMSNTDFAMSITDKFNEIGNKFSITSGGIGEAMKRSASSLDAANNSIDESIALITAANTVVQDPDRVGRFCRL